MLSDNNITVLNQDQNMCTFPSESLAVLLCVCAEREAKHSPLRLVLLRYETQSDTTTTQLLVSNH